MIQDPNSEIALGKISPVESLKKPISAFQKRVSCIILIQKWAEQLPGYDWDVGVKALKKPKNPYIFLYYFLRELKIQQVTQVGFQKWAKHWKEVVIYDSQESRR
jgi:hypothetical protein